MLSSDIKEVDLVAIKSSGENKTHTFKSVLINGSGPRPHAVWKPKTQAGPHKALLHKSDLQHLSPKHNCETQPSISVFTDTVNRVPQTSFSSLACNTAQPSVSGLVPEPGSLASHPFTTCDTAFGLPSLLSSKLPDQQPLFTQKVGISFSASDAVGMESEKGSIAKGSEKSEPIFTKAPHDFGPTISDFVGDLGKTWGNSKEWMLELRDGRKLVILLSANRSPESMSDQTASEGVVNPGLTSLFNEGQFISWAPECDGVGGFVVSDFRSEGEAWDSDEGLSDWEHLDEPLEVAPPAMDNSVVMEITKVEEIGR